MTAATRPDRPRGALKTEETAAADLRPSYVVRKRGWQVISCDRET